MMMMELEAKGYSFEDLLGQKISMSKNNKIDSHEKMNQISQIKIIQTPEGKEYEMERMEKSIGKDGYVLFKKFFDENKSAKVIVYGNRRDIKPFYKKLVDENIIDNSVSVFIAEGYDEQLEKIYEDWREDDDYNFDEEE